MKSLNNTINKSGEVRPPHSKLGALFIGVFVMLVGFVVGMMGVPGVVEAGVLVKPANNLGLVAYYSFNEGQGLQVGDFSGNGNNASISGSTAWVQGKFSSGFTTENTTGDKILAPDIDIASEWTASAWFKYPLSSTGSSWWTLFRGVTVDHQIIVSRSSNLLGVYDNGGTGFNSSGFDTSTLSNGWHHIATVGSGTTQDFYIDGEFVGTASYKSTSEITAIGNCNGSCTQNWGKFDDVRVYNRALGASEVVDLYESGFAKIGASRQLQDIGGLTHWYTFDGSDVSTTTVTDVVGGNDGTIENGPFVTLGRIGQGMQFNSGVQQVDLGVSIELGNTDWTMSTWVKTSSSGTQDVLSNQSGGPVTNAFRIFAGGNPGYYHYNGAWQKSEVGTSVINDGEWHFIAWANDGNTNTLNMYVNGELDLNGVDSTVTNNGPVNRIGRSWAGSGNGLVGVLDDMRVYASRTLSADEVQRIYNATRPSTVNKTTSTDSLGEGLVSHWSFDGGDVDLSQAGAEVRDSSGNGNHGDAIGGASPGIGKIGQGYVFDGVDDVVQIPNSALWDFGTGDLSVSFWFKTDSSSRMHAFNLGTGSGNNLSFDFNDGAYGVWVYWMSGGSPHIRTTTFYNDGNWHHLVFRRNGTAAELFVDNISKGTLTNSTNIDITGSAYIGATGGSFRWDGRVDDVRVYDRALSDAEVERLYNLGR